MAVEGILALHPSMPFGVLSHIQMDVFYYQQWPIVLVTPASVSCRILGIEFLQHGVPRASLTFTSLVMYI